MKNFFTWIIGLVLLSLCVLEKEAKKNAVLMQNENGNDMVEVDSAIQQKIENQPLITSGITINKENFASDTPDMVDARKITFGDSLSFL
jgi:hypothetical protein